MPWKLGRQSPPAEQPRHEGIAQPFVERDFAAAEAFLDALSPHGKSFGSSYERGAWFFRGQSEAGWSLRPSALRPSVQLHGGPGKWTKGLRETESDQIRAEAETILQFLTFADLNGLPLPEDSHDNRLLLRQVARRTDSFAEALRSGAFVWPPDSLLSLCALAQHHGIPTRLLDWTQSGYVASYFAAYEAAKRSKHQGGQLAVWAIRRSLIEMQERLDAEEQRKSILLQINPPSAGNPNLLAQKGLFILYRPTSSEPSSAPRVHSLEQVVKDVAAWTGELTLLYKLTLPLKEAPKLLRLLATHFIDASTLFPGFDGVSRALRDQIYWDSMQSVR